MSILTSTPLSLLTNTLLNIAFYSTIIISTMFSSVAVTAIWLYHNDDLLHLVEDAIYDQPLTLESTAEQAVKDMETPAERSVRRSETFGRIMMGLGGVALASTAGKEMSLEECEFWVLPEEDF